MGRSAGFPAERNGRAPALTRNLKACADSSRPSVQRLQWTPPPGALRMARAVNFDDRSISQRLQSQANRTFARGAHSFQSGRFRTLVKLLRNFRWERSRERPTGKLAGPLFRNFLRQRGEPLLKAAASQASGAERADQLVDFVARIANKIRQFGRISANRRWRLACTPRHQPRQDLNPREALADRVVQGSRDPLLLPGQQAGDGGMLFRGKCRLRGWTPSLEGKRHDACCLGE